MLHFQTLREGLPLFRALGSDTRIAILELLIEKGPLRMTAIAEELQITGGALTTHVRMLNEAGILSIEARGGRHGIQKICRVNDERIVVESPMSRQGLKQYDIDLELGQFVDVDAVPPCGAATPERRLQPEGDPSCFTGPELLRAGVLWMQGGSLEYLVPNFMKAGQRLTEVQISLEAGPGNPQEAAKKASALMLHFNGKQLGQLALPLADAEQHGMFNPSWWNEEYVQSGTLHRMVINEQGTFADGERISDMTLSDLGIAGRRSLPLKLSLPKGAAGLTLFGRGFGSTSQGIRVRMYYQEDQAPKKKRAK